MQGQKNWILGWIIESRHSYCIGKYKTEQEEVVVVAAVLYEVQWQGQTEAAD